MKRLLSTLFVLFVCGLGSACLAWADTVVLNEDFEGIAAGLYTTGSPVGDFFVQSGSVDVLAMGFFDFLCTTAGGSPTCIDQDGSASGATFSSTAFFPAGTYNLSFDLAGSQRGDTNLTTLFFGNQIIPFTLASDAPFTTYAALGVIVGAGGSRIVFDNTTSADNFGNLLDNVQLVNVDIAAVPEPSTYLLFATGLVGLLGYGWRKRRLHS